MSTGSPRVTRAVAALSRVRAQSFITSTLFLLIGCAASAQSLDDKVREALAAGRSVPVIVRTGDLGAETRLTRLVNRTASRMTRGHRGIHALGVRANAETLRNIVTNPGTVGVSYDAPVTAHQAPSREAVAVSIDASGARQARERYEVTGRGVRVAVIDSGVQPHVDLPLGRIAAFVDFVNGRPDAYDDYGHGTHVAGIIAGSGALSEGRFTGVAPGAEIVALKVLDGSGIGSTSDVLAALEWVEKNAADYNIRVVNLSIGHPVYEPASTDPLVTAVEALAKRGIAVVTSAGNWGLDDDRRPVYGGITSPGTAPSAVTVGAQHTRGTLRRSDDGVVDFSSRGPTRYDLHAKPDLVAPGASVTSLAADAGSLLATYPQLTVEPGYLRLSGTSMAAPVAAGAAALMFEANAALSAHTIKAALQFTAQPLPNVDALSQGTGALNIAGAVRMAFLIDPTVRLNRYWLRTGQPPSAFDELFGEPATWARRVMWGGGMVRGDSLYVRVRAWDDARPWSQKIAWPTADSIVWSSARNVVWSTARNIVWSTGRNIVWSTGRNIVWSTGRNIVWSTGRNIVWSTGRNIVWSTGLLGEEPNVDALLARYVFGIDTSPVVEQEDRRFTVELAAQDPPRPGANLIWASGRNIVWSTARNIVWSTTEGHVSEPGQ